MAAPSPSIRDVLLTLVRDMAANRGHGNLQQTTVLKAAWDKLVPRHGDPDTEEAILTQWQELFRTGLLAWGYNLSNPDPPFFHLTESGRNALANVSRDPSNPEGYLRHLDQRTKLNPLSRSYLVEGLDCYVAGFHKAAAVMVGVAAEGLVLTLRDAVVNRLRQQNKPVSKELEHWMIRPVTAALTKFFDHGIDVKRDRALREQFENYWTAFTGQIRVARNDAGHPINIEPVTVDTVHASLLIFPELAALVDALSDWVTNALEG